MNQNEALHFLAKNQPMPDYPDRELMDRYREVTRVLAIFPTLRSVPLLLNSFAEWEDLTVYDSVQTVLRNFTTTQILPYLVDGLNHTSHSVSKWSADTARLFPHPTLIKPLAGILVKPNAVTRMVAAAALERIGGPEVRQLAREALPHEPDEDVQEILNAIVNRAKTPC